MNNRIEQKIKKIYEAVFKKVFNEARKKDVNFDRQKVNDIILKLEKSRKFKQFNKKFSVELAKLGISQQRGIWREFFNNAKKRRAGVLPKTYTEFQEQLFKKAIIHNFRMIKSIPEEVKDVYKYKYIKTLMKQTVDGSVGRGTFEKVLRESGATRAKLIARTETAKLQTTISENRATDLGSVCYLWRASNDKRTRPSHKAMNNVIVFWRKYDEKPLLDGMRGNAGEFPNCRCAPQPLFDEEDLTKNTYEVYDYRSDTVVSMTRQQLSMCIKNKQIV